MSSKTNNLTERLVNGAESSPFLIIVSSIRTPVKTLFDTFLQHETKGCLLLTNTVKHGFQNIPRDFEIYDYFEDIEKNKIVDICEYISSIDCDNTPLFIDSLTPLLKLKSNAEVCKLFVSLKKRSRKLVCVINKDCISELSLECVSQISNTVIEVTSVVRNFFSVKIVHKKANSRTSISVLYSNESFNIENDFKIKYCKFKTQISSNSGEPSMQNLPFNLSLKDDERRAKDQLVMPYTKVQETSMGKVYYEPDKNDDIDEEDPDDDLNI